MSDGNLRPASYDKLTPKQQAIVDALFSIECKGDLRKAAKMANCEDGKFTMTEDLRQCIADMSSLQLGSYSAKAAFTLNDVLSGNPDTLINANAMIKAATELLDRAGLSKVDRVQITGVENSLVILPAKKPIDDGNTK